MNYIDFAKKVKTKYPEYNDMDDRDLAERLVKKYPEYSDVTFDAPPPAASGAPAEQPITGSTEEPQTVTMVQRPVNVGGDRMTANDNLQVAVNRPRNVSQGTETLATREVPVQTPGGPILEQQRFTPETIPPIVSVRDNATTTTAVQANQGPVLGDTATITPYTDAEKAKYGLSSQNMMPGAPPGMAFQLPRTYDDNRGLESSVGLIRGGETVRQGQALQTNTGIAQNPETIKLGESLAKGLGLTDEALKKMRGYGSLPAELSKLIPPDYSEEYRNAIYAYGISKLQEKQVETGKKIESKGKEILKTAYDIDPIFMKEGRVVDALKKWNDVSDGKFKDIEQSWRAGNIGVGLDQLLFDVGMGGNQADFDRIAALKDEYQNQYLRIKDERGKKSWVEGLINSTTEMLPPMVKSGAMMAIPGVGPALSTSYWARQGAGDIMYQASKRGVPLDAARSIAIGGGLIYAGIEQSQVGKLSNMNPILKGALQNKISHLLISKGIEAIDESLIEENVQQVMTDMSILAAMDAAGIEYDKREEFAQALRNGWKAGVESIAQMGLISLPGTAIRAGQIGMSGQKQEIPPTGLEKPQTPDLVIPPAQPVNNQNQQPKNVTVPPAPDNTQGAPQKLPFDAQAFWSKSPADQKMAWPTLTQEERDAALKARGAMQKKGEPQSAPQAAAPVAESANAEPPSPNQQPQPQTAVAKPGEQPAPSMTAAPQAPAQPTQPAQQAQEGQQDGKEKGQALLNQGEDVPVPGSPEATPAKTDYTEMPFEEFQNLPEEEKKKAYSQFQSETFKNPVTKAPGQRAFDRDIKELTDNNQKPVTVAVGDLNGLKEYNDVLMGMAGADQILRAAYDAIALEIPEARVYHLHGDEYAVIAPGLSPENLQKRLTKAMENLSDPPFEFEGKTYRPTMSIMVGQAVNPIEFGALNPKKIGKNEIGIDKRDNNGYNTIKASSLVKPEEIVTRGAHAARTQKEGVKDEPVQERSGVAQGPGADLGPGQGNLEGPRTPGGEAAPAQNVAAPNAGTGNLEPAPGVSGNSRQTGVRPDSRFRKKPLTTRHPGLKDNQVFQVSILGLEYREKAKDDLGLKKSDEQYKILTGQKTGALEQRIQNWLVQRAEALNNEEGWSVLQEMGLQFNADSPVMHDDIRGLIADSPATRKELDALAGKYQKDDKKRAADEEAYAAEQMANQNSQPKQAGGIPANNPGVLKEDVTWYFPPHESDPTKRKAVRGTKSQRITYFVGNGYTSLTKIQRGRKPNPTILWKLQKYGERSSYIELTTPEEMEYAKKQIERKTKGPAFMREEIEDENGTESTRESVTDVSTERKIETLVQAINRTQSRVFDQSDLRVVTPDDRTLLLFEALQSAFPEMERPYLLKLSERAAQEFEFSGVHLDGSVFVNSDSPHPVGYILTHETIHYLEKKYPAAYAQLDQFISGLLTDKGKEVAVRRGKGYNNSSFRGRAEIIADTFASHAHEPTFWQEMYNIAPEMVRDILKAFKAVLDKFIATGSKQKRWDEAWFKDAVLARKAVAQFVADMSALENGDMEVADAFNGAPSFMRDYSAQTSLFDEGMETLPLFQNEPAGVRTKKAATIEPAPEPKAEKPEPKQPRQPTPKAPKEIEDFGAKIGGARKDYYAEYADKFERAKNADIVEVPLSQSWPEPDYEKLLEAGNDPWVVGFVRAARDEIPTKPQRSYRLKRWADDVLVLRNFAESLLSGNLSKEKLQEVLKQQIVGPVSKLAGRAELYQLFGHDKSLKGVDFAKHHYSFYNGEKNVTKWVIEQRRTQASAFSNMPHELGSGNTKEEAIADFKAKYNALGEKTKQPKKTEFLIYRRRDTGKFYIVKKMGAQKYYELKSFDTAKEASEYRAAHQTELEAQLERWKQIPNERREFNRERIGQDHRGGVDVTPEMFSNTFGFRGVEFGNWVNNAERQDNLNRAFDSLYDLANILKVPTRAISLNGELGIGFGSRGHGGKRPPSAHYESDRIVINLTKKNGPGSLAHEWWHAFDNYISRRRGKPLSFVTEKPFALPGDTTRQELVDAVKGVLNSIDATDLSKRSGQLDKRRTDAYWDTTVELTARSFEGYVIEKLKDMGATNDYLANIEESSEWLKQAAENMAAGDTEVMNDYPYLLADEMPPVKKALDKLFSVIKTSEEGDRVPMFMREESVDPFYSPLLRAVQALKQERGTGEQMFNMLTKAPGVKEAEWKWMGLDDFLKGKPSVTKAEIEGFVRENQVQIEEALRGIPVDATVQNVYDKNGEMTYEVVDNATGEVLGGGFKSASDADAFAAEKLKNTPVKKPSKYNSYTLPGGYNYREVLLTIPQPPQKSEVKRRIIPGKEALYQENKSDVEKYNKKWMEATAAGNNADRELWRQMRNDAEDRMFFYTEVDPSIKTSESQPYKSSHWEEPNVVAHIRLNDRTGSNGEKVLFVEEIQSDWAREAREKGVRKETLTQLDAKEWYGVSDEAWSKMGDEEKNTFLDEMKNDPDTGYNGRARDNSVPNQPFLKNWEELTLKRILRMAAEEGYDRVAWINGKQTANRYDLSKQITQIQYFPGEQRLIAFDIRGDSVLNETGITENKIDQYVGKDAAQKLVDAPITKLANPFGSDNQGKVIEGEDLKIGGEWAINLYDRMIPKFYEKYGKKWGTKVEPIELDIPRKLNEDSYVDEELFAEWLDSEKNIDSDDYSDLPSNEKARLEKEYLKSTESKSPQQSIPVTPEMRESVLYEGQPMFMREDLPGPAPEVVGTEREQLDEIYRKARATKPTLMQRIFHTNKSFREYKDQLAAEMLVPISTRLKKIGPQFKEALRKFEYNLAQSEYKDTKAVEPWLKALKKMDPADQSDLDLALKNGDTAKTEAIIAKYKLEKEWANVREVLDGIHFRSIEAGFDINYIRDYYPRKVIDPRGLIEAVSGEEEFGQINDMIRKEQEALGRALTEGEKAEVVNTFLARPDRIIEAPGALKKRSIRMIDNELDQFYDYSPSALLTYLHEMNKAIEQRKFFGLDKNKTEADAEELGLWNEESRPRQGQIISDITDGINRYVLNAIQDHKLSDEQQDELVGLLKARFNYRPTGNTMQMIKNLGYLTTMGSGFSSFVSQLGDLAWAFYVAGPIRAAKAFGKAMAFKSELKKEDLGLERIAEEFRTSRGLGKVLNFVFKTTLLQRMDNVGKESLINGLLDRYRKEAKKNDQALRERAEFIFGKDEAQQVLDDLAAGKTTENIKYMLFNRLLDFQPIALSEMPALYLKAPNGRILYMLKTFTIKQLDVFRNEGLSLIRQGIADGNPKMVMKGMRNLTYLIALFIMANAAADQIKDWLFGRKPSFSDKVYDNIFRLFGLSRFLLWEIRRTQDIPSAIAKMVAPPADILEMPLRDAVKILKDDGKDFGEKIKNAETWKTIPYLGKHYYWWFGGGREGEVRRQEKNNPYADYERKIRQYKSRIKAAAKSGDREKARKLSLELSDYVKENAAKAMEYKREHPTKESADE